MADKLKAFEAGEGLPKLLFNYGFNTDGKLYRGFRPLCHLNWAKVRTKATASEFASYNLCENADISAQKYTCIHSP